MLEPLLIFYEEHVASRARDYPELEGSPALESEEWAIREICGDYLLEVASLDILILCADFPGDLGLLIGLVLVINPLRQVPKSASDEFAQVAECRRPEVAVQPEVADEFSADGAVRVRLGLQEPVHGFYGARDLQVPEAVRFPEEDLDCLQNLETGDEGVGRSDSRNDVSDHVSHLSLG